MTEDNKLSEIEKQSKIFFDDTYTKYKDIIDKPLNLIKSIIKFNDDKITESKLITKIVNNLHDTHFSIIDDETDSIELLYLKNESDLTRIIIGFIKNPNSTIRDCFLQQINTKNKLINSKFESGITLTQNTFNVSVESLDRVIYFNYFFRHNSAQTKFPHFSISGTFDKYDNAGFPVVENGSEENIFLKHINAARLSETLKEHDVSKLMSFFYSGKVYDQEECDLFKILHDYDLKNFNEFFLNTEKLKVQHKNDI